MGVTNSLVPTIRKLHAEDKIIAIAGNPNVGKSTLFNKLTGMHQHTGNWPGKTVAAAQGFCKSRSQGYVLTDIPGTYSLMAQSPEELAARRFLCFGTKDAVAAVCDATCLERNLNLILQILEACPRVLVCVNFIEEAKRKGITLDLVKLQQLLGAPVCPVNACKKNGLQSMMDQLDALTASKEPSPHVLPRYGWAVEQAAEICQPTLEKLLAQPDPTRSPSLPPIRWIILRLLEEDPSMTQEIFLNLGEKAAESSELADALKQAQAFLRNHGLSPQDYKDRIVRGLVDRAESITEQVLSASPKGRAAFDRKIDGILTSPLLGYPLMLGLLALIFWITITGANYPSQQLAKLLSSFQEVLSAAFAWAQAPEWLHGLLVLGAYRVLSWVVSVMLPPMAIFFPLFTLLEDSGYLPRIAYCLDRPFQRCGACGKQALTMAMGFGCNAAGVTGCRIIDSPRERLIAMLTNNFVPCNGRFPTLAAMISMFIAGSGIGGGILASLILTGFILLGILMTFAVSRLLSATILKGVPSFFTLELPPYRRPQILKVIIRSVLDRTLFVLGRAAAVAAPAGMILWILANLSWEGSSLLELLSQFLDPLGRMLGMDGVILMAFILGMPANEIVLPIAVMAYTAQGTLEGYENLFQLRQLLAANGWTWVTAVSTMLFSLMHWPCSTTLLTIKKESGSWKWTALAFLLPTLCAMAVCFCFAQAARFFA